MDDWYEDDNYDVIKDEALSDEEFEEEEEDKPLKKARKKRRKVTSENGQKKKKKDGDKTKDDIKHRAVDLFEFPQDEALRDPSKKYQCTLCVQGYNMASEMEQVVIGASPLGLT